MRTVLRGQHRSAEHEKPKLTKELTSYGTHRGRNPSVHRPTPSLGTQQRKETHNSKAKSRSPPAHKVALAQGYTPPGSQARTVRRPEAPSRLSHRALLQFPCGPYPPH